MRAIARDDVHNGNEEGVKLLLGLKAQLHRIEEQIERLSGGKMTQVDPYDGRLFRFDRDTVYEPVQPGDAGPKTRKSRPPLPDPRLVRLLIRRRQARARFFDKELFADPAWDILLDLTAAREEHVRVSITSLCIASGVPLTTALRWISQMCEAGLLQRDDDAIDRRRAFISLTDRAANAMARYFAENSVVSGI